MRFFQSLFSLACAMCAAIVAFALSAVVLGLSNTGGHFSLLPGEPRSIADTRRMGLA